ncbi:Uncharacterised protein [Chlamydia abortus]|nr:Uncharacterised protein [Chlamydia abortus]
MPPCPDRKDGFSLRNRNSFNRAVQQVDKKVMSDIFLYIGFKVWR